MHAPFSILLVEEDAPARGFLADNLTADGYQVIVAADKTDALAQLARGADLVLCDSNGDTLELIDAVRHGGGLAAGIDPNTPLIVLTEQADTLMRVRYFEHGGDDVISKPIRYAELLARVRAVLRRSYGRRAGRVLRLGELEIDTLARSVRVAGAPIELAGKEYALLVYMAGDPTRVFTKNELLRDVWGFRRRSAVSRTLDSHAVRLRHKLRAAGSTRWMENVWGVGYRLAPVTPHQGHRSAA